MEDARRVQRRDAREQRVLREATNPGALVVLDTPEREPPRHTLVKAGAQVKAERA